MSNFAPIQRKRPREQICRIRYEYVHQTIHFPKPPPRPSSQLAPLILHHKFIYIHEPQPQAQNQQREWAPWRKHRRHKWGCCTPGKGQLHGRGKLQNGIAKRDGRGELCGRAERWTRGAGKISIQKETEGHDGELLSFSAEGKYDDVRMIAILSFSLSNPHTNMRLTSLLDWLMPRTLVAVFRFVWIIHSQIHNQVLDPASKLSQERTNSISQIIYIR